MTKILIIKLGYSETLDAAIGRFPSLGDVLRTTPILGALREKYPCSHITWLVDAHAEALLDKNPLIDQVIVWDNFVPFQLMREKYDVLINLEKIPGVCALADMIDAWVKYGFRFESVNGTYHAYERGLDFIEYIEDKKKTSSPKGFWQQVLVEMIGVQWKGQEYIIGYRPGTVERYDIGINFEVGSKWPNKALPMDMWRTLERTMLESGYSVSWQEGRRDLREYMDWLNSCRVIISNDSLGLHLAQAFKKKVIGVFGPTNPQEIYFYGESRSIISKSKCDCMPCYGPKCSTGLECMRDINLSEVMTAANNMLNECRVK